MNVLDGHAAVHGLAHVIDGQGGDTGGRNSLHFHPRFRGYPDQRFHPQGRVVGKAKDRDRFQR